ncbi:hypothetical protein F511_37169 [Dorcoceras hygrometricum]|uniref:Uncharacterized protein n=1 Tax=Dorcoceras hygrometricum TaxID=472368 RepID=A0A2Z7DGT4_9LAMI|nr:hypothetical protein F511_37169 [Dorcoceras hygrometricum]
MWPPFFPIMMGDSVAPKLIRHCHLVLIFRLASDDLWYPIQLYLSMLCITCCIFHSALSVIPRGSCGDIAKHFTMIRWCKPMKELRFQSWSELGVDPTVHPLKGQFPHGTGRSQAPRHQQAGRASYNSRSLGLEDFSPDLSSWWQVSDWGKIWLHQLASSVGTRYRRDRMPRRRNRLQETVENSSSEDLSRRPPIQGFIAAQIAQLVTATLEKVLARRPGPSHPPTQQLEEVSRSREKRSSGP